jgi:catechol O-methyltransferase
MISIGPDKSRIVKEQIQQRKPHVMVELGGYVGYSAIDFGDAMRRQRPGEKVQVWSLEFNPLYAAIAMSIVDLAGMSDIVKVVTGAAADSLKRLKEEGKVDRIDLLFVDHPEEFYVPDLKVCESLGLLKSGTCIAADNVVRPGAPEYREYVRSHPNLTSHGVKGLIMPGEFEVSASWSGYEQY